MDLKTRGPALWLFIFIAGAAFQLWRISLIDTLIYAVVAMLVAIATQNRFRTREFKVTRFTSATIVLLVGTLVFVFSPIHSWLVAVFYLMLVPILIRISWQRDLAPPSESNSALRRSSRIWTVIGLLTCLCELGNYFASEYTHNDKAYPTITVLVDPIVANTWGKAVFVMIWAGIGVGLVRVSTEK